MTTREIAINGNGTKALDLPADYVPVAGYEKLDPDDFSLPTLKLVQAQSRTDGAESHPGEYVKTDTGEYYKDPRALIVGIQKSRILFPSEYASDNKPLCRSDDSLHPRTEYVDTFVNVGGGDVRIAEDCADCPLSQWGADGEAPACTLSENWAAILDTQDIVILRLKGTSAGASKMLKNIMRANRLKKRSTYVQLGSVFTRSDKGNYWVATLQARTETPPIDSLDLARQLSGVNLASRAADEGLDDEAPGPAQRAAVSQSDASALWDDPNEHHDEQDDLPF